MAHDMAMLRMIQAGAVPMNWLQVFLELQWDWARKETYDAVLEVVRSNGGTYGLGVECANAMWWRARRHGNALGTTKKNV